MAKGKAVAIVAAQTALCVGLLATLAQAVETAPGPSTPTPFLESTREPYPTCINRFWLDEPITPCAYPQRTLNPVRAASATANRERVATWVVENAPALATADAWETADAAPVLAGATRTPCPIPPTPVRFTYREAESAPCFYPYREQTQEARTASGESYAFGSRRGPDGTMVPYVVGTVPTAEQAWLTAQPATQTALVATAIAEATAGLPDLAMRNDQRRDRREMRRYWRDATATAAAGTASVQP